MIWVYENFEALSNAAAGVLAQQARQATQTKGWFSVALSGGHTPQRTCELLAEPPFRDHVPWRQVHVFWGDERCVAPDDPRNNAHMARQALLDRVPIPAEQIHPIICSKDSRQAAEQYEALLRSFFADQPPRFDLVFLGLGENGHTASLFPGSDVLEEQQQWVSQVHVPGQELDRVSLTAALINEAGIVAFLVAGTNKAAILQAVLEGPHDPHRLPAQLIKPRNGTLYWLVDKDAAQLLSQRV
jgi:6-phosphogluconolactonase